MGSWLWWSSTTAYFHGRCWPSDRACVFSFEALVACHPQVVEKPRSLLTHAFATGLIVRLPVAVIDSVAASLSLEWPTKSLAIRVKLGLLLDALGTSSGCKDELLLQFDESARRRARNTGIRSHELRQKGAPYYVYQDALLAALFPARPGHLLTSFSIGAADLANSVTQLGTTAERRLVTYAEVGIPSVHAKPPGPCVSVHCSNCSRIGRTCYSRLAPQRKQVAMSRLPLASATLPG